MTERSPLRLLVLDGENDFAQIAINRLRKAGQPLRAQRVEDEAQLECFLAQDAWDLILAPEGSSVTDPIALVAALAARQHDLPILLESANDDPAQVTTLLRQGIAEVIPADDDPRLLLLIQRQHQQLLNRRATEASRQQITIAEARAEHLANLAGLALAYLQDGMHMQANSAYSVLFGYDDPEELLSIPFLDLITPESTEPFKAHLRLINEGDDQATSALSLMLRTADDNQFAATLHFVPTHYQGESCLQLWIRPEPAMLQTMTTDQPSPAAVIQIEQEQPDAEQQEIAAELIRTLEQAIDGHLLSLLFEPIVGLNGASAELYECHLMLIDNEGKEHPGSTLWSWADAGGLSRKLNHWHLLNAIKRLVEHRDQGHQAALFVNLPASALLDDGLTAWLSVALRAADLPSHSLIVQIDERDTVHHLKESIAFTERLRELNCPLSLRQFGRSEDPFRAFRQLNPDYVQIAPELLNDAERLKKQVRELQSQGKLIIAPAISSAKVMPMLFQLGINFIEGSYLQSPMNRMDFDFGLDEAV